MRARGVAAVLWLGIAAPTLAAETAAAPPGPVISKPDWELKPSARDMSYHFPPIAQLLQLGGETIILCDVAVDGHVQNCKVDAEQPTNLGFGAAALGLSTAFRMKPKSIDGVAVAGGSVRIPIVFSIAKDAPTTDRAGPMPPPTERAKVLALRIVRAVSEIERSVVLVRNGLQRSVVEPRPSWPGASPDQTRTAIEAYATATETMVASYNDDYGRVLTEQFSESELERLAEMLESPTGQLWLTRTGLPAFGNELGKVRQAFDRRRAAEAVRIYCEKVDCKANPIPKPERP